MTTPQYSLTWETYRSSLCSGLSSMQQNGDFVDMTIAADGHMVKVHQLVMALVSPYIKELIASTKSQHPVIFLNNVSYTTLCHLLEYIYSGEVLIPVENFKYFMTAAKALHIRGLENMTTHQDTSGKTSLDSSTSVLRTIKTQMQNNPFISSRKHSLHQDIDISAKRTKSDPDTSYEPLHDDPANDTDQDASHPYDVDAQSKSDATMPSKDLSAPGTSIQFTVSNRGSLQLILNRFMYNLHSNSQRIGLRRWRCVNYRNAKCPAYVSTKGNTVVNRGNPHNHAFHDKKILSKIEQNAVYSTIDDVKGIRDSDVNNDDAENDTSTEQTSWDAVC